jgi:allantoin racemase
VLGDPGLDAARELTAAPVVGIGEAAYIAASLVAKRFADHHPAAQHSALEEGIDALGLRNRCRDRR